MRIEQSKSGLTYLEIPGVGKLGKVTLYNAGGPFAVLGEKYQNEIVSWVPGNGGFNCRSVRAIEVVGDIKRRNTLDMGRGGHFYMSDPNNKYKDVKVYDVWIQVPQPVRGTFSKTEEQKVYHYEAMTFPVRVDVESGYRETASFQTWTVAKQVRTELTEFGKQVKYLRTLLLLYGIDMKYGSDLETMVRKFSITPKEELGAVPVQLDKYGDDILMVETVRAFDLLDSGMCESGRLNDQHVIRPTQKFQHSHPEFAQLIRDGETVQVGE